MVVLYLAKIMDQNGPSGHWIFIDIGQKVNIDAENLKEVPLNQKNLFDCDGPCSLCMEFRDVINICLPDSGQRIELMKTRLYTDGGKEETKSERVKSFIIEL
jgi:hypothetical protein